MVCIKCLSVCVHVAVLCSVLVAFCRIGARYITASLCCACVTLSCYILLPPGYAVPCYHVVNNAAASLCCCYNAAYDIGALLCYVLCLGRALLAAPRYLSCLPPLTRAAIFDSREDLRQHWERGQV